MRVCVTVGSRFDGKPAFGAKGWPPLCHPVGHWVRCWWDAALRVQGLRPRGSQHASLSWIQQQVSGWSSSVMLFILCSSFQFRSSSCCISKIIKQPIFLKINRSLIVSLCNCSISLSVMLAVGKFFFFFSAFEPVSVVVLVSVMNWRWRKCRTIFTQINGLIIGD